MDIFGLPDDYVTTVTPAPSPPPSTTVAEDLLLTLVQEGVSHVFGVPGASIVPFYAALSRQEGIQTVLAKHETGAVFMADGYARAGRRLGVCCASAGPGSTNALTGVASAFMDSVPLLFLSGQVSTACFGRGAFQESSWHGVDLVDLFRPVTKVSAMAVDARAAPRLLRMALRCARSGRPGPVHLSLPGNVLNEPAPPAERHPPLRLAGASGDGEDIASAAALLARSRRPAILAGHGVNLSGAWAELRALAERFQIPVATTPQGKGVLPEDHPLSLGVFGFGGHALAADYLLGPAVDLLLVVGSSLGEFETQAWDPRLGANRVMIQIDIDPSEIGKSYPLTLGVVADARAALRALEARLAGYANGSSLKVDQGPLAALRRRTPRFMLADRMGCETAPIKPQRLVRGLVQGLPDDALVFVDIGNCMSWMFHYFQVRRPGTFFNNQGLASMGYAVPAAIGASFAAPGRPVVAVMGDGAFAMNGMEIHTAVEHDVPLVCVVLNDGGFGMVAQGDTLFMGRPVCPSRYRHTMDIAAMGRAMGARGVRVDAPAEFDQALREALTLGRPTVIDARIDPTEVPATLRIRIESMRRMIAANARPL